VWGRTVEAFVGEEAHFVFNSFEIGSQCRDIKRREM
jgi:hypothetical protein